MPRFASLRVVAVAALLLPLFACGRRSAPPLVAATSPITVDIKCEGGVSVGLTDASGKSAWSVALKKNDPIEWLVPDNIISIDISAKGTGAWPLDDVKPHGSKKAQPAKSKVKSDAAAGTYAYLIETVCQRADGTTINVTIDPDMIVL